MTKWRLLDTGALPASLNMGIDEALLHLHVPGESQPTLRFYTWYPPAVSLGYFQRSHSIDLGACRKLGFDVVRRVTGGKAHPCFSMAPSFWSLRKRPGRQLSKRTRPTRSAILSNPESYHSVRFSAEESIPVKSNRQSEREWQRCFRQSLKSGN